MGGATDSLQLLWILLTVPSSLSQPPLSLPVQMSVVPPPWTFLPLFRVEPGSLFSNSSPFSFSQSVFLLPPAGPAHQPGLQASFGPYSVTQLVSEPLLHVFPSLHPSVLSEEVERERDDDGLERFRVRVLFQEKGDTRGTCIILHAFKETEQHKASCVTQLGLCVVTLTLPSDWFKHNHHINQSRRDLDRWYKNGLNRGRVTRERHRGNHRQGNAVWHQGVASLQRSQTKIIDYHKTDPPQNLGHQRVPSQNQIQLYYSTFHSLEGRKQTPARCAEDSRAQSQNQMFYIGAVALKDLKRNHGENQDNKMESCLDGHQEAELIVDSHVVIRYHRGPVLIGQPIKASISLRANFSAALVVIRMKVKKGLVSMVAQRTLTSDFWTVTLERSQSLKHDVMSIFCHKQEAVDEDPSLLLQVVCLSISGLRRSFGVAMTASATWWVEYPGQNKHHGNTESFFSFTDRRLTGIVPIADSKRIINTAILTNQPVSIPVTVLAVGLDEKKVADVTSAVACRSASEDTIKVSSDCAAVFVDGSESGLGSSCAVVEFQLGMLSGSLCVEVWAPSVPLQVLLGDPVLNAIDGWNLFTEDGCVPVYQRTSVQILTQFTARDSDGKTKHLLDSSDWLVDVTQLVHNWLRIEDPKVASLGPKNVLIGLKPGKTSLHVLSEQWDGVLGRCDVTVTSDPVVPGDLSAQVVSGLGMSLRADPKNPAVVTTTVTAHNTLHNVQQEASVSVWLQFSDDSSSLLSAFGDIPFSLLLSSLARTVVGVTAGLTERRVFARGDGGGPLVEAELLVSSCDQQLVSANSIGEDQRPFTSSGAAKRLARGSGWVRVNLDQGSVQPKKNEEEEFEFDISELLFGPDNESEQQEEERWMEVVPGMDEVSVFFSPSHEVERKRIDEEEKDAPELQAGIGVVLSLFCLSALLFLINCLPCALRDRVRSRTGQERPRDPETGDPEPGDPEPGESESGDSESFDAEDRNSEDVENRIPDVEASEKLSVLGDAETVKRKYEPVEQQTENQKEVEIIC